MCTPASLEPGSPPPRAKTMEGESFFVFARLILHAEGESLVRGYTPAPCSWQYTCTCATVTTGWSLLYQLY